MEEIPKIAALGDDGLRVHAGSLAGGPRPDKPKLASGAEQAEAVGLRPGQAEGAAGLHHGFIVAADELQQPAEEAAPRGAVDGHDGPELRAVDLADVVAGAHLVDLVAVEHQVAE